MEQRTKEVAVLGGDARQKWLALELDQAGVSARTCLVQDLPDLPLEKALDGVDGVVFPVPALTPEGRLHARCATPPTAEEILSLLRPGTIVFGGRLPEGVFDGFPTVDLMKLERVAAANAVPTAEGAIQMAMEQTDLTLQGSRCLVIGWGRIGKLLAKKLRALDAEVTVSVRSPGDAAMLQALGFQTDRTGIYDAGLEYDLIFNTVPAMVLDRKALARTPEEVCILDLASAPGGVDFDAAAVLERNAVLVPGLPGKVAPRTAGRILGREILAYL